MWRFIWGLRDMKSSASDHHRIQPQGAEVGCCPGLIARAHVGPERSGPLHDIVAQQICQHTFHTSSSHKPWLFLKAWHGLQAHMFCACTGMPAPGEARPPPELGLAQQAQQAQPGSLQPGAAAAVQDLRLGSAGSGGLFSSLISPDLSSQQVRLSAC